MYCRECGEKLTLRFCENEGLIPYCAQGRAYMFPQFPVAVSMVVTNRAQDKILLAKHVEDDDFILFAGYVKKGEIQKNKELVNKWKVIIARVVPGNGEVGVDPEKGYRAITKPRILEPNEINTFSYMLLGAFDAKEEAEGFKRYLECKFPRFLLRLTYSSMNIARANFMFVPKLDYAKEWTDEKLYAHFDLSSEEIELIEKTIRPFEEGGEE